MLVAEARRLHPQQDKKSAILLDLRSREQF